MTVAFAHRGGGDLRWRAVAAAALIAAAMAADVGAQNTETNRPWLPHWPIGFDLPDELGGKRPATGSASGGVLVWVPEGAERIRSVLVFPDNTDSVHLTEHPAVRRVAAKHQMGMVYLRYFGPGIEHRKDAPAETNRIQRALNIVAAKTGIAEFRHAPWITLGKSSRGEFPFRAAWLFPERTIATMDYHAETPTWPPLGWARLGGETIFHVNVNGETEWGGTWFNHVRPSLLNYRTQHHWLAHQVVSKGVDHGNYPDGHGGGSFMKPFPAGSPAPGFGITWPCSWTRR